MAAQAVCPIRFFPVSRSLADGVAQRGPISRCRVVGEFGRGLVVVPAACAGEGVFAAGVAVQLDVRPAAQAGEERGAGLGRAEGIRLGDVQHQPAVDAGGLAQQMFDADPVVADGAGDVAAGGRQIGEPAVQAEADEAGAGRRVHLGHPARRVEGGTDVRDALVDVEPAEEGKGLLLVGTCVAQLDAGLETPENRSGAMAT